MGKPGPNTDRSCSGYLPRYIVHRVSMKPLNDPNGMAPKMAKQRFAFDASTRTRFLKWAQFPAHVYHDRNRGKCKFAPLEMCHGPGARSCICPVGKVCGNIAFFGTCTCHPPGTPFLTTRDCN
jgi:hypothetical protein